MSETRLAINYSPEAAQLLAEGAVEVDLFKCPDWPDVMGAALDHRPIYVHFPLVAGRGTLADTDWLRLETLLEQSATGLVNVHLHADPDAADPDALAERWLADLALLSGRFGAERVVAENIIYFGPGGKTAAAATDPDLISRVLRDSGVGLLLDLAHARISALHYGCDARDYIAALPTERLRELHVTGTGQHEGRWRDHLAMSDADWALLVWGLEHLGHAWSRPDVIALEYGGVGPLFSWRSEREVIARSLPRLRALLDQAESRLAAAS
ncbi:MAG: DUF692 family protein [Trueperaceae bacterium]|nr:DUF692 family protein [Trueperaceae bacterium]